jgi:hypothetical protein
MTSPNEQRRASGDNLDPARILAPNPGFGTIAAVVRDHRCSRRR